MKSFFQSLVRFTFTLILVLLVSRSLVRFLPGDPAETLAMTTGTTLPIQAIRTELGLDIPLWVQFGQDIKGALKFDWGRSILSQRPIAPQLRTAATNTLLLASLSFVLASISSFLISYKTVSARGNLRTKLKNALDTFGAFTSATPMVLLGSTALVLFAVKIPIFPVSKSIWLPSICLAISLTGSWARLIDGLVFEHINNGCLLGSLSRGRSRQYAIAIDGFLPCLGTLGSILLSHFGFLLMGAFVTETLFGWDGLGSGLVDAILKRDYPLIQAYLFSASAMCLSANLAGELFQRVVDPRVRS